MCYYIVSYNCNNVICLDCSVLCRWYSFRRKLCNIILPILLLLYNKKLLYSNYHEWVVTIFFLNDPIFSIRSIFGKINVLFGNDYFVPVKIQYLYSKRYIGINVYSHLHIGHNLENHLSDTKYFLCFRVNIWNKIKV